VIGTTFAHYEITGHLGTGGMGEVYQATDSKLARSVAIKFLPETFAQDTERLARFQREARVLASLNHPNIAAIHGLEEAAGRHFLVMELVPGETLAERIQRGPIPVDEPLGIARQIIEALDSAHEKGVIHRDLKPANLKTTPEGNVKVLDFGLAKTYDAEPASLNISNSPTISRAATQQGVILGTAAYMSPEQARGKTVDRRADIWAFGVLLYEMLTGARLFDGETVSDTLAAVLEREVFEGYPVWNPSGSQIAYGVNRAGVSNMRLKAPNGVGAEELPFPSPDAMLPRDRSSDGRYLVFDRTQISRINATDIWILPMFGEKKPIAFLETAVREAQPQVSPDGQFIAYVTNVSGKYQIVVRTFPDANKGQWQITSGGGTEPRWRRKDGRELYYLTPDGKIMAVAIPPGPTFVAGASTELFQAPPLASQPTPFLRRYDVTAEGQRFLFATVSAPSSNQQASSPITAVINWPRALKKK
jgi:serine/threonine protein kinase